MFQPDEWQQKALLTWYSVDNPLHLDPRHPCIKLAGEAGEILDLYGKEEYKPGFDWWDCKHCRTHYDYDFDDIYQEITNNKSCDCNVYTPLILDELGDYSYYLRILAYQKGVMFEDLCRQYKSEWFEGTGLLIPLSELFQSSSNLLEHFVHDKEIVLPFLVECANTFLAILDKLDTPLEQVLELNYKKLNSEETNHGWKSATIKNRS